MFYILDTAPLLVTQSIPSVLTTGSEHRCVDYSHEVKTAERILHVCSEMQGPLPDKAVGVWFSVRSSPALLFACVPFPTLFHNCHLWDSSSLQVVQQSQKMDMSRDQPVLAL